MDQEKLCATRTISAPAETVFAVLADPVSHAAIDGTGWVRKPVEREPLTEVGQVFRMGMFHESVPGGDYQMVNRVEVLDAPRAIGWLPGRETGDGQVDFGGWLWRYDLVELGASGTEVTLTYDWSAVPQAVREELSFPPFGPDHLGDSLDHLAQLVSDA